MNKKTYADSPLFQFLKRINFKFIFDFKYYYFLIFFKGWTQNLALPQTLDEVYISSSRFELDENEVGKSIIKITAKEIKQNIGLTLSQLLNTKVGITVNGSYGQSGSILTTNIRGGINRQVLVLIDGIAVNDPSQIENNFDFNFIALDQIEFIEILKGPSSVLYGTNASTAVINIVTKKVNEHPLRTALSSVIGTNNTAKNHRHEVHDIQNTASVFGAFKKLSFTSNLSHHFSDGLSSISPKETNNNFEKDNFERTNLYLKLIYAFSKQFSLSSFTNLDRYATDYDESFGFIDADYNSRSKQLRTGINLEYEYQQGSLNINAAYTKTKRSYDSSYPTKYSAKTWNFDLFNTYKLTSKLYSTIGLKYSSSEMDSYVIPFNSSIFQNNISGDLANDTNFDLYLNFVYTSKSIFNFNGGVRLNHHSEYDTHLVYSINPSFVFNSRDQYLKLFASFSTAFITPSLYQLFAPNYGNILLNPQEDATLELGFEISNPSSFKLRATVFQRTQNNFIDYVVTNPVTYEGNYKNMSVATIAQGLETELKYIGFKHLNLDFNYAFIESKSNELFKIPKHKINFNSIYELTKRASLSLSFQYNSRRISPFKENSNPVTLKAYCLVNLGLSHQFFKNKFNVFANVSNLLDEIYRESYRYSTLGRNYKFGVIYSF